MARARKRHVQVEMGFRTWGGKRAKAGRRPKGARAGMPHVAREVFERLRAVHVTVRVVPRVGRLRRREAYHAIRLAMCAVLARADFRIVHISLEHDHIHLIVEAENQEALANGMRGFQISAAQRLNRAAEKAGGACRGKVFADRYHTVFLRSPTQARNAMAYTLLNWRKHRQDDGMESRLWSVDYFSSGPSFEGWKEYAETGTPYERYRDYEPLPTAGPQSWILNAGWRLAGSISLHAVPGATGRRASGW